MVSPNSAKVLSIVQRFNKSALELGSQDVDFGSVELELLKIDSLSRLELVMALEEEFGCEFPELELTECKTIADLLAICERHASN